MEQAEYGELKHAGLSAHDRSQAVEVLRRTDWHDVSK
jgi:hypothetical protein